jgi:hypothetical protein
MRLPKQARPVMRKGGTTKIEDGVCQSGTCDELCDPLPEPAESMCRFMCRD